MSWLYTLFAVVGGTVMVCQFVMTLIGIGGDADFADDLGDVPHDLSGDAGHSDGGHQVEHTGEHHSTNWLFGVLTFRTVIAAITFFGLAGLGGLSGALSPLASFLVALTAGAGALFGVHWIMSQLHHLQDDGTVRIGRAVGKKGIVYLSVPPNKTGAGKVHLNLQNRTVEYLAMTVQDRIPTGAQVVVTEVLGPDTVAVAVVRETETPNRSTVHA
ncbi:MAG: hypothetical protein SGJ19_10515 [Planctomycetia bacterium]|nr:hypothetical protein [Planctomycetia bacterium]